MTNAPLPGLPQAASTILLMLATCLTGGCTANTSVTKQDKFAGEYPIEIVATTGMVSDLVRQVGGDHVTVTQLCGAGVDPHLYKPTRDDVALIMQADLVFYSGLMLEGKMSDTLIKIARTKPVVAVTEVIDGDLLLEPEGMSGHYDPHVWNDVAAWSKCVDVVAKTLSEFDPDNAASYQASADAYQTELERLHQYGLTVLATIPDQRRVLITSHDAFNYFGRAYGLEVLGVQGLSTESEAGIQRINELVDLLVDRDIQAVFIESSVSPKNIDALIEGAASKNHSVVVGGELYSDATGPPDTYEGTYLGMLDHNITVVTRALGGKANATGLHGKLSEQP